MEYMIEFAGGDRYPKKKIVLLGAGILVAIVLIVAGLFIWDYLKLKNDPAASNKDKAARITREVSAIFEVPQEEPTVVLVEDKEKLKGQEFFNKAENGDYLLIYSNAKLAMLYREKIHKLINAGPVNLPEKQEAATPQTPAPAGAQKSQ